MTASRPPMPLDYSSFTSFIEHHDNGRLLLVAQSQRRSKLLAMFEQGRLVPGSVSVAFSPRPLESTDLLDDLRCLVRSVETLEQENKRLQSRNAFLSTINDLLNKAAKKPMTSSMSLSAIQPKLTGPMSQYELVVEDPPPHIPACPAAPMSPVVSASVGASPLPSPMVKSHPVPSARDSEASSNRLSSFGAKMTKAATKFLGGKQKKAPPHSKSVRVSKDASPVFDSVGSLLGDSSSPLLRSRSVTAKHRKDVTSILKKAGTDDSLNDSPARPLSSRSGAKSEDEMGSPESIKKSIRSVDSAEAGSLQEASDSAMVMSSDSLTIISPPADRKSRGGKLHKLPSLDRERFPSDQRDRAWTWDLPARARPKPWDRLKQMLRRASAPHNDGTAGILNDSVAKAFVRPLYASQTVKESEKAYPKEQTKEKAIQTTPQEHCEAPARLQFQGSTPNMAGREEQTRRLRMSASEDHSSDLTPGAHLLALATSGEVSDQQETQKKLIAQSLTSLKTLEDYEAKLDELPVPRVLSENFEPAVHKFLGSVWKDLRSSFVEIRSLRRAHLSDRLKLIEWANGHCTRLLNADQSESPGRQVKRHGSRRSPHSPKPSEKETWARYNESTGLRYGKPASQESNGSKPSFKPARISRRWYTFGAADRMPKAQYDVSRRLAASLCALFSTLEPLGSLSVATSDDLTSRCEEISVLFKEAEMEIEATKRTEKPATTSTGTETIPIAPPEPPPAVPVKDTATMTFLDVADAATECPAPPVDDFLELPEPETAVRDSKVTVQQARAFSMESDLEIEEATRPAPTARPPPLLIAQSCSLDDEPVSKPTIETVNSQPQFTVLADDDAAQIYDLANRRPSSQHLLMSADELIQRVARSRSSSITGTPRTSASQSMSLGTTTWPFGENGNLDKRRSIAEMPASSVKHPSFAALTVALEFAKAARERASSTGSRLSGGRLKTVKEPEALNVTSPMTSPKAEEKMPLKPEVSLARPERTSVSSTPPLAAASPTSIKSIRDSDSSDRSAKRSPSQIPYLPSVHRIAPKITVSADKFSLSGFTSRGRIKSLVEIPTAMPIAKIFASRGTAFRSAFNSPSRSTPSSSSREPTSVSTPSFLTSSNSNSTSTSKSAVVTHLSPPPILPGEPSAAPTSSSEPTPSPSPDFGEIDLPMEKAEPSSKRHPFGWFSKLLRKSPGSMKRFSSCDVGPATLSASSSQFSQKSDHHHSLGLKKFLLSGKSKSKP